MTKDIIALIILTTITAFGWIWFKAAPFPKMPQDTFIGKTVEAISPTLQTDALEKIK